MPLQEQLIADAKKDNEWCKRNVVAIMQMSGLNMQSHYREKLCYDLYHGRQDPRDFEYLTGTGELHQPAAMRFIPIIKPFFDLLESTVATRPFGIKVYTVDTDSVNAKQDEKARRIVDQYSIRVMERQQKLQAIQMRMEQTKQMISQQAQDDPSTQLQMQEIEMQIGHMEKLAARSNDVLEYEAEKLERYFCYDYQTMLEVKMNKGLEYVVNKYGIKETFLQGFRDLLVTDNAIYEIADVYLGQDPQIIRRSPLHMYYSAESSGTWLDEREWAMCENYMTFSQVMADYGEELTGEERDRLRGADWSQLGYMDHYSGFSTIGQPDSNMAYSGSLSQMGIYRVCRCAWLSPRKLTFRKSENKNDPELEFTHVVTDNKEIRKNDKLEYRFVTDAWEGTRIGTDIYVRMRKCPFQHRDVHKIGKAYLPWIGYAYNGVDRQPYSRAWAVRDLQILYNMIHYQMELLIALSGVKGMLMDHNQLPEGMSPQKQLHFRKQGVLFINPSALGPNGRPSNFNQWQQYDDTLSQGIMYLKEIASHVEYLCGRVIGIPPQRLGEVMPNDQVTTHQSAVAQSSKVTAVLEQKHFTLVNRVLTRFTNCCRAAWAKGKRGQYVLGNQGQQIVDISAGELDSARYEVMVVDGAREDRMIEQAQTMLQGEYQRQTISLRQLVGMFNVDSFKELEANLEYYEKIAQRRQDNQVENEQQHQAQLQQADQQLQMALKKRMSEFEALKGQLEAQRLQLDAQTSQMEVQGRVQQASIAADSRKYVADTERGVEMAYLQETERKNNIDARLEQTRLLLDGLEKQNTLAAPSKEKVKD